VSGVSAKGGSFDLALQTTHAKVRMDVGGVCKLFRQEVKSMAVRAWDSHCTKSMMIFRLMVLLAAKRNWEWHLDIAWSCWMTHIFGLLLTQTKIRISLQLDAFCITDLHILLFWMRLWRRWLSIFPRYSDIALSPLRKRN